MSGLTPSELDPEEAADTAGEPCAGEFGAGKPGAPAAVNGGAATIGGGSAAEDDTEPPAATPDAPAPSCAGGPPDEEDSEAPGPPDGSTPPCPAILTPGPDDGTLPPRRYHHEHNKIKCWNRRTRTMPKSTFPGRTRGAPAADRAARHWTPRREDACRRPSKRIDDDWCGYSSSFFSFSLRLRLPPSLCLFSKKMAGSNVDGDEAAEGRGLNRRAPSSLRNGPRATRCFETRAATNGPLRCNRRDALTLRVLTLQF